MGLALGTLVGLPVFLGTLYSLLLGRGTVIANLAMVLPGFHRTYVGAFVGLVGGFAWGFIGGALLAWLYNTFQKTIYRSGTTT